MDLQSQQLLPAIRSMKSFEKVLDMPYTYCVLLDLHISMLKNVLQHAVKKEKKMFVHVDLIQGLSHDEAGTEYLCQELKPYGIISTKSSVIEKAKQKGVVAIQRAFIIDSNAMKKSVHLVKRTNPDFIELLPGVIPKVIKEVYEQTGKPIIAGGLIDSKMEVDQALQSGATAVTTSNPELWKLFLPK
ncbi:glycerol-3-phosphate responsive antiterminator [Sutcliffiella cohnii]